MKRYVFAYVKTKDTPRRTYGGHNYTLTVYDITGGKVQTLGTVDACTAAHKGESSEAWSVVLEHRPGILATLAKRAKGNKYLSDMVERDKGYFAHQFQQLGVELHAL